MQPAYADITDRIADPPDWFTVHGVPRWGEFHPGMLGVYDKIAGLFEIACQACDRTFLIGVGWSNFATHQVEVRLDREQAVPRNVWLPLEDTAWIPASHIGATRTVTINEILDRFSFGDPPTAGPHRQCTGATMASDGPVLRQAWRNDPQRGWERDTTAENIWWSANGDTEEVALVLEQSTWEAR